MKDKKMKSKKTGFTLIELLVVIAIIALLLAILVPTLNKAKMYAEEVMCKSNLHQYQIATELYITEHGERYPYPWASLYKSMTFTGEVNRSCRWHNPKYNLETYPEYAGPYWPYLAVTKANICPVFKKIAPRYGTSHDTSCIGSPFEPQFSYSMNGTLFLDSSGNERAVKRGQIASPSQTFLWAEENMWKLKDQMGVILSNYVLNDNALCADGRDCFASYHKISTAQLNVQQPVTSGGFGVYNTGEANVLMVDGSSAFLPPTETKNYAGKIH
jgi:prepilin-type N-terminal cleavage/methylation domain-containing protein/prepilin-type processing-associated H-X9-DG protein